MHDERPGGFSHAIFLDLRSFRIFNIQPAQSKAGMLIYNTLERPYAQRDLVLASQNWPLPEVRRVKLFGYDD